MVVALIGATGKCNTGSVRAFLSFCVAFETWVDFYWNSYAVVGFTKAISNETF